MRAGLQRTDGILPCALLMVAATGSLVAQQPSQPIAHAGPIAIVPVEAKTVDAEPKVTGSLEVAEGKAIIGSSGSVTAGTETVPVLLPGRGTLKVCASTTVKLAADTSVPAGETPGLLMALDHGAVEMSYGAGRNSDILMTPDFRVLITGPGAVEVKVRLGTHGDTCIDNAGQNAPYVLVSSIFDGGAYRVQPGQRVMFQQGSLREVVDQEKEPCGCPPAAPKGNEFPLAQSEGLAPPAVPSAAAEGNAPASSATSLNYNGTDHAPQTENAKPQATANSTPPAAGPAQAPADNQPAEKKKGFFSGISRFFRKLFGAES